MTQTIVLTDVGKAIAAGQIAGTVSAPPKYLAVGTGVHTAAASDTALTTPAGSRVGTNAPSLVTTTVTNDTVQIQQTYTAAADVALTELGAFDAATSGNMFISATFDPINLYTGDSIQLTVQAKFA